MKRKCRIVFLLLSSGFFFGQVSHADEVNFDLLIPIPTCNECAIPSGYGSTPNAAVTYNTLLTFGGANFAHNILFWNAGYGNLPSAGFQASNGLVGDITLTPLNGNQLVLNNFTMAGWPQSDLPNQTVEILNASNQVLWSFTGTIPGCCSPTGSSILFSPDLVSSGPLSIEWGTSWDVGTNYINFNTAPGTPVPEPSSLLLLGSGILAALTRRRIGEWGSPSAKE